LRKPPYQEREKWKVTTQVESEMSMQHHRLAPPDGSPDERGPSSVPPIQQSLREVGVASGTVAPNRDRHPRVVLTGDLRFSVTEQEVARGPIIGQYTLETQDMQEPLRVLWHAQNGRVLHRCARSTAIAFDLYGAGADQIWTSVITVQMTDAETFDTIIKGTFVQILVTKDPVLSSLALPPTLACPQKR
jgi:hypothetical protein